MKFSKAMPVAFGAVALGSPQPLAHNVRDGPGAVQVLPANITGADKAAFPQAPAQLDVSEKDFLTKYQPLSDAASAQVAPVTQETFSATGFCFAEFPCLSVSNAAVGTIGSQEEVEREQVAAILDQLTSSPEVQLGAVDGRLFSGLRIDKEGATLDVIGLPGSMPSKVLGGMVFDMFKLQSDDVTTNSIRATQAKTDGNDGARLALCLYPSGVDALQAYYFCVGKELDGSDVSSTGSAHSRRRAAHTKRGLFDDLFNVVCGFLGC